MSRSPRSAKLGARPATVAAWPLQGPRVALRPLSEDDLKAVVPWYEGTDDMSQHLAEAGADVDSRVLAMTLREDGRRIGVVGYRVGMPEDGWLEFGFVTVEPGLLGLGLDSEAVRLVEKDALERGLARRFLAGVNKGDGLGLYFWLRLGYRPARPDESPWRGERPSAIMLMVRLAASAVRQSGS